MLELFCILAFVIFLNLDLICSLHCQDDVSCLTKIILFKTDTLSKCTKILFVRKKQNLKYAEFVLPSYIDDIRGFHMSCYRKFTALWLFCNKERKKIKEKEQKVINVETVIFEENIRKYANWKEDNIMLAKTSHIDFVAKEVKYGSLFGELSVTKCDQDQFLKHYGFLFSQLFLFHKCQPNISLLFVKL